MEKKKKRSSALLIIVFIAGIAVMFYPSISNLWNTQYQKRLISTYSEGVEVLAMDEADYGYELEKAIAYNDRLWPSSEPEEFAFLEEEDPSPEYMDCLNIGGDGIMGYVEIPKIDVELPIYHTADDEVLAHGAGHLEGTSLPVGGTNTHCVISAHRGLPGMEMFTNINKLELGDHFFLNVLDETLAYEVDQILVVNPEDISPLLIIEGEDLCTLLTCTPYGVNTDRLLVRGHHVELDEEELLAVEDEGPVMKLEYWLLLAGIAVAVIGIAILLKARKKKTNR